MPAKSPRDVADDALGQLVERLTTSHHRRRLRRVAWTTAIDAPPGGWAEGAPPPRSGNVLTVLVDRDGEHDRLEDLDGLAYRYPALGILMTVFMLSLAGFPPLVGFIGKFFLFSAGVSAGWTWLVVIAVLASVISVAYYTRVIYHVWTPGPEARRLWRSRGPVVAVVASGILAVILGIYPTFLLVAGLAGAVPVLGAGH